MATERAEGFYWTTWAQARRHEPQIREFFAGEWRETGTWQAIPDSEITVHGDQLQPGQRRQLQAPHLSVGMVQEVRQELGCSIAQAARIVRGRQMKEILAAAQSLDDIRPILFWLIDQAR